MVSPLKGNTVAQLPSLWDVLTSNCEVTAAKGNWVTVFVNTEVESKALLITGPCCEKDLGTCIGFTTPKRV